MKEVSKDRSFDEVPTLDGAITLNRVVSLENIALYKQAAEQIQGVVVSTIVGPNSTYGGLNHAYGVTGANENLIRVIATPDQLTQLASIVKKIKEK